MVAGQVSLGHGLLDPTKFISQGFREVLLLEERHGRSNTPGNPIPEWLPGLSPAVNDTV